MASTNIRFFLAFFFFLKNFYSEDMRGYVCGEGRRSLITHTPRPRVGAAGDVRM